VSSPEFRYSDLLPTHGSNGADETPWRLITTEGVSTFEADGQTFLRVSPEAIQALTAEAMHDISHYLRPGTWRSCARSSTTPRRPATTVSWRSTCCKNVNISAGGVLPMCQDTGTAIVMGKKSSGCSRGTDDGEAISRGVYDAYTKLNLRYSQLAPLTTYEEKNTGTNLPAQIEIYSTPQATSPSTSSCSWPRAAGRPTSRSCSRRPRRCSTRRDLGVPGREDPLVGHGCLPAVPPRDRDRRDIGGVRAEGAKYASAHYLDDLPTTGSMSCARLP
jgi:fumarate hydratase class I